ncbi:MAG: mechanosensitive ion channel, partial [Methylicorpusculum sp.]|nr:mechanosensitive ion channel [Methylicorpusculum sp.]
GFIIAFMAAISTLGLDLSNLAMIAGALSVGIGFGLQNVVNNFVSGLILLIERPVKVGDWVVVGDQKGHIKKINVRATEIETSDRATLFIPNSELISRPLMNWTHANQTGRLILPVQIAYGTDIQKVKAILLKTAAKHPEIQKYPEPNVLFRGYGESGLNLELRAFLFDVEKVNLVMSDLFFEIDDLFRQEGIEIPYPQRDIQLKDSDKFLQAFVDAISNNKHH